MPSPSGEIARIRYRQERGLPLRHWDEEKFPWLDAELSVRAINGLRNIGSQREIATFLGISQPPPASPVLRTIPTEHLIAQLRLRGFEIIPPVSGLTETRLK
jgi:hypothetical protein